MTNAERIDQVRKGYERFLDDAEDPIWVAYDTNVVFHIAGSHPLSGDYAGVAAVRAYLATVTGLSGDRSGFSINSVFTDDSGDLVLVEGTAFHAGDEPFVRTIVHLLRFSDDRLVEFWDNPFDQPAEDSFWRARVPTQRDPRTHRPAGLTHRAGRAVPPPRRG